MRTPLTICKGTIKIAQGEEDIGEIRTLLKIGNDAMVMQNNIIGDLISIAEMQRRTFKLQKEPIDLAQAVLFVVKEFEAYARKRKIKLKTRVYSKDICAWGN